MNMKPVEIWKDIPGYVGRYQASNLGCIKSLPNSRRRTELVMKLQANCRSGYLQVRLTSHDGSGWRQRLHLVNRLVCAAFHGEPDDGMEACHRDGNHLNNSEDNLYWGTRLQNEADKTLHGTSNKGSRNWRSVLNEEQAAEIKARLRQGVKVEEIAADFSVSVSAIKNIKNGYNWRQVA